MSTLFYIIFLFFFFSSRRRHTRSKRDWSSDVCSSDLDSNFDNNKIRDFIYPIGSIYMSVNNVNPTTLFGGTWVQMKDKFLLGAGDTYENGNIGDRKSVV